MVAAAEDIGSVPHGVMQVDPNGSNEMTYTIRDIYKGCGRINDALDLRQLPGVVDRAIKRQQLPIIYVELRSVPDFVRHVLLPIAAAMKKGQRTVVVGADAEIPAIPFVVFTGCRDPARSTCSTKRRATTATG